MQTDHSWVIFQYFEANAIFKQQKSAWAEKLIFIMAFNQVKLVSSLYLYRKTL